MQAAPAAVPLGWSTARSTVSLERPVIAGILNVTPDSFWDGGVHAGVDAAVRHAAEMVRAGAAIIDVGGESTRPGASPITAEDEVARVVPVVEALAREWPELAISVDTVKASVAQGALDAGASIINDVSALRIDPALAGVVASAGAGVILMHSRGSVDTMARYDLAEYGADPAGDVVRELNDAVSRARAAGIADDRIVLDPGLGFAKRTDHSIALLAQLNRIVALGHPVMVGPSRKRFTGDVGGECLPVELRLEGTLAA